VTECESERVRWRDSESVIKRRSESEQKERNTLGSLQTQASLHHAHHITTITTHITLNTSLTSHFRHYFHHHLHHTHHSLHITLCTSLSAHHSLHIILCTSLSAHHSLHITLHAPRTYCRGLPGSNSKEKVESSSSTTLRSDTIEPRRLLLCNGDGGAYSSSTRMRLATKA